MKIRDIEIRDESTNELLFIAKNAKSYRDALKQYSEYRKSNKIVFPSEYYARNK